MEIRIRSTGKVVLESEFRAMYPNTGFPTPLTSRAVNDFGGDVVLDGPQPIIARHQIAFRDGVQEIEGQWYTRYSVLDMDDSARSAADAEQAKNVRASRSEALSASDWTQVADAPVDKVAWAEYRQALRDIPSQTGFPWDISWPQPPT